jgi:WD40 repeat protein
MLAKLKVIDATPLQIYTSLLVFSPEKSIIRTTFIDQVPKWISQLPEVPNEWGESLQTWEGHSHKVMTIAFSHNSTLVASGSWDSTVRIWRVDTGESLQTLKGHKDAVVSVVFSHNSALVASGSLDETVRIWRADTGACTQILQQGAMGSSIAFSHDSSLVASASGEKTIHIWRVNTGQCVQTITARNSRVVSVCFSHDSALLVAGSTEETVQIWRADAGEYMPVQILQTLLSRRRRHMVANIKVSSHDSALLASTSTKETVQIWRNDSGEYTPVHFLQPLEALRYTHPVPNIKVSFSHDSALLASITGPNGVVRIYRAEAGEYVPVQTFVAGDHLGTLGILSFAIRHDSVLVASRQGRHRLQLETWRADAGKYLRVHTFATGRIQPVSSAAISHDASLVAMGCRDSAICILPVNSGETAQSRDGDHSNPVMLAFSHDSSLVVSCGDEENTIKLWRSDTGELVRTLEGPSPIKVVALSHNSDLIAAASTDRFVRIWCADTGDCVQMITEQHVSRSIAFSHDSALLATVDKEAYVDVWRADTGGHVRTLGPVKPADSQSIECRSITFSRHSIFIAGLFTILPAIQDTQRIQIWRADTGQCVQTIIDGNMVKSIAFHSDLELLVSTWSGITSATWTWCVDTDGFVQSLGPHPRHTYCHLVSSPSEYMHTDCGTSHYIGGEWIAWNDEAVIMVPAEYTHGRTAISGSTIAFGTLAGEVTILGLSSRPCGCIAKMPAPKCIQVYKRSLGY